MKPYKDSTLFLLPLIGIDKKVMINEHFLSTYIIDYKFLNMSYYISIAYKKNNDLLETHKSLYGTVSKLHDSNIFYYFGLPEENYSDYDKFLTGRYSTFSKEAKEKIIKFWNANNLSLIYGVLYKTNFAKLLYLNNIGKYGTTNINKSNFEYWNKPNISKETYKY